MTAAEIVTLPDPRVRVDGALDLVPTPDGLHPRRLPAWTRPRIADPTLDLVADATAGVRLAVRTAARSLALRCKVRRIALPAGPVPASFDVVVDGGVVGRRQAVAGDVLWMAADPADARLEPGEPETLTFTDLPAGLKDVEIWLPHAAGCSVSAVVADAPLLVPSTPDGLRWVHHGSSISHGIEAPAPTLSWPVVAALRTGANLTHLGFAGNAVLDPDVARAIADRPADLITCKVGINIVDGALMRERTFVPAVHGFLDLIRAGHPDTPLVLVSPVSCPLLETSPGPTLLDPSTGRIELLGSTGRGALTLERVRELLARAVEVRADPVLRHLDGRELFGPDEAPGSLPDGLHPDAAAHLRMGERAARLLLSDVAAFR